MESLCRIEKDGRMPGSIRFMMLENAADRIMRACFKNRWSMVWYLFLQALRSERERVSGSCYRFWRYKIQGRSPDADWHQMMTQMCPRCNERHEMAKLSEELYQCSGCSAQMDEGELIMAQPEDEDE
jgi:ribosomal protein L37AE/L43A